MKKLLTAAVASTFAFLAMGVVNGDEIINQGADFEAADFVVGEQFNAGLSDDAQSTGDKYWYTEDTEADNVISNHSGAVGAPRPDKFASDANTKFLKVETSGKLWRSVKNNSGSSDFLTNTTASLNVYGHSLADSAIYLDTLVKFTPADSDFSSDLTDGDKIAISYVEREEERDSNNNVTVEAATNFVIRAGLFVGGQLFQTNYYAYLPDDSSFENFDKDAWHRLTVRTIPDVGDGSVGFVVYVDETNLTYSTSVDAGFGTLNATALGFYNNEKHALFPSAVGSGAGKLMISAASFSGNGSIDDVVFTTTKPTFIAASETPMVTVTWDTSVISAITIAGAEVTGEDFAAGSKIVELEGAALAVTATPVGAYELVYSPTYENGEFTGLAAGDTCSITGFIPLFDVNGTHYADLDAALEAAAAGTDQAPATLKLLADCDQALNFTEGYIVLDLAGCDIQGNGSDFSIGNSGATLIITNSGAEASILIPADNGAGGEGTGPLMAAGGFTTIQAGTFEGIILTLADDDTTFKQDFVGITGGKFLFPGYDADDPTSFYLYACVAQGLDLTQAGDYVIVGESGGSGGEDWPTGTDLDDLEGQKVSDIYSGISADFDKVDAKTFVTWASGVGDVAYADKGSTTFNIDCFLLNIANDSTPAAIAAATATAEEAIKITAITFDASGNPVITAPASYGNGVVVIEGSVSLDPISWHEKDDGDHFFHAKLVVDEVVTP